MTHTDLWKKVKENLKKTHPQHAFSTWFEPIVSIGLNNDELILEVPNQFFFEWIQSHYKESISMKAEEEYGKKIQIKYLISQKKLKTPINLLKLKLLKPYGKLYIQTKKWTCMSQI